MKEGQGPGLARAEKREGGRRGRTGRGRGRRREVEMTE